MPDPSQNGTDDVQKDDPKPSNEEERHEEALRDPAERDEELIKTLEGDAKGETQEQEGDKEEVKEEESSASRADEFDAEILGIAADLGVSENQARAFGSVKDLERALYLQSTKSEDGPAAKEVKKEEPPLHLEATEDLDDSLVKQINSALDRVSGKFTERSDTLEKTVQRLETTVQSQQAAQFLTQFDALVAEHGVDYTKEMGEGGMMGLSVDSKERKNRDAIVDELGVLVASYQIRNRPLPGDEQLLRRALTNVFGDRKAGDVEEKTEVRRSQFLRRGSSRAARPKAQDKQIRARLELREKLASLRGEDEPILEKTTV